MVLKSIIKHTINIFTITIMIIIVKIIINNRELTIENAKSQVKVKPKVTKY